MTIRLKDNIGNSKYFYWYEATKNGILLPETKTIHQNIELFADYLDAIRGVLGGKPMLVTSWYRPPIYNKRIGGAINSQHLTGKAVDFYCRHLTPNQIYEILNSYHGEIGGLGCYPSHVHIDCRGTRARWIKKSY